MAVTLKDVAALAGVSPSTVSRTCKDNPSISEETKERVRRAMAQLGYDRVVCPSPPLPNGKRPAPLALSSRPPRRKSTKTPSIWRPSGVSASSAATASI